MSGLPGAGGLDFRLDASAVLVINELEQEEVEQDDEYGERGPEHGGNAAEGVPVFVQRNDVLPKSNASTSIPRA